MTVSLERPLPYGDPTSVVLGHGSGGRLSHALVEGVLLPELGCSPGQILEDQAIVDPLAGRPAITTDSFVVRPLFFPGGDIGSLAVYGTVNDLAVGGAVPRFLSLALIIEEGLAIDTLRRIAKSIRAACSRSGVRLVTGDTKVVERGKADGLFITTTGVGVVPPGRELSARKARPGDRVVVSGPIGDHGIAVLSKRERLEPEPEVASDSAPVHGLVLAALEVEPQIRCLRDPTRGGLSSALNEIARASHVGIRLEERAIPIRPAVRGACGLFGFDPLYVACGGRAVAIVPQDSAERVVEAMRARELGAGAAVIGEVVVEHPGIVTERSAVGAERVVPLLSGEQLTRIC